MAPRAQLPSSLSGLLTISVPVCGLVSRANTWSGCRACTPHIEGRAFTGKEGAETTGLCILLGMLDELDSDADLGIP